MSSIAGSHGARWVVEVDGASCVKHRAVFEREIALACEAMGTCRIAARRDAELEATLSCDDAGTWRLQTRTVEGAVLGSIELAGTTPEDRMREAAIEIARDAAPERTLATEMLRNTLESSSTNGDKLKLEPRFPSTVSMAAGGILMDRANEAVGYGLHVSAGYRIGTMTHLTFGLAGLAGGSHEDAVRRIRSGVGVAFGAPFNASSFIGVLFEGGVDGTQTYARSLAIPQADTLPTQTQMAAYVQQTVLFQLPLKYVRPYTGFTIALLSTAPNLSASAEVGVSFPLF